MKKSLVVGAASLALVGVVGVTSLNASALTGRTTRSGNQTGVQRRDGTGGGNGYQSSLESRAKVFGMTAEQLQEALKTKTMSQIAVEKGMSEDTFRAKMNEMAKARWESRGLSNEEIAQRIKDREARHVANSADHEFGSGDGNHMGGYGRNR